MSKLNSWLARKLAGLIVSDQAALEIVRSACTPVTINVPSSGIRPEDVRRAIEAYDEQLGRTLPQRIVEAERRFG